MINVRRVTEAEHTLLPGLCELLVDAVHGGASVGFLAPLSLPAASRYWEQVLAALGPTLHLWVAESGDAVAGAGMAEGSPLHHKPIMGLDLRERPTPSMLREGIGYSPEARFMGTIYLKGDLPYTTIRMRLNATRYPLQAGLSTFQNVHLRGTILRECNEPSIRGAREQR